MSSSSFVLVTGGTGFIGSHIVSQLLARGTKVRAVARSEESAAGLRNHFAKEVGSGALTFAFVPDMTVDGAFDEVVKGVDGIVHAASPMPGHYKGDARRDILDPAIKGATGILRSAAQEASVKSVVLTSSGAAYTDGVPSKKVIDDDTWATRSIEVAEQSDSPATIYSIAKFHAEKAAWQAVEELGKPYRFATLAPMYVAGRTLLDTQNVSQSTNGMLWAYSNGNFSGGDGLNPMPWVHVHDIAAAHIVALDEQKANGKRFLLIGDDGTVSQREIAKLARGIDASLNDAAEPGNTREHVSYQPYVGNNAKNILGIKFLPPKTMIKDVVEQGLEQRKAGIIA